MNDELTHTDMLDRMYASDPDYNGRFITGVLTTGIYCLPSCPARKPLAKNVHFFESEAEAIAAGLRACKRCKPDLYYAGVDPDQSELSNLHTLLDADPAHATTVGELAKGAGMSVSRLYALVQKYEQTTPGELIHHYRILHARRLLLRGRSIAATAFEVGYESLSAFYDRFKQLTGLTPAVYRNQRLTNSGA